MFRPMRRSKQQLSDKRVSEILKNGKTGILAVNGDNGFPYTVPVNYVYFNGKIYIHCAKEGHKIDAIKANNKVSFCVIDSDEVFAEKLTTLYRSAVVFGKAEILNEKDKTEQAVTALGLKYNPDREFIEKEISKFIDTMCCIEITPSHITGKEAVELSVRQTKTPQC